MTSPAGIEVTDPQAYLAKMEAALAGRDPFDVLAATPDLLLAIVSNSSAEKLRSRPYPDRWTWTPLEVIGHLVDSAWTSGWRVRTTWCDDGPTLQAMNQEKWVSVQRHNDRNPAELAQTFAVLSAINLRLYRQIDPKDYGRTSNHVERGRCTLGDMLRWAAGHEAYHLEQLQRYVAAIAKK